MRHSIWFKIRKLVGIVKCFMNFHPWVYVEPENTSIYRSCSRCYTEEEIVYVNEKGKNYWAPVAPYDPSSHMRGDHETFNVKYGHHDS